MLEVAQRHDLLTALQRRTSLEDSLKNTSRLMIDSGRSLKAAVAPTSSIVIDLVETNTRWV
jgi:hypothetical protein